MTAKVTHCDECGDPIELPEEEPEPGDFQAESAISAILDHYADEHPDHPGINHPPSDRPEVER